MCHMGVLRGIYAKIDEMGRSGWKKMGLSESKKWVWKIAGTTALVRINPGSF